MSAPQGENHDFRVTRWVDVVGGSISRRPRFWIRMGNLESRLLSDEIEDVDITRPIYISGLARSGSTILLEVLSRHGELACHRYSDYPLVFTPYWWNRLLERMPKREVAPSERTHRDGIKVTPDSPEAFEEVLWMTFFAHLHDPSRSAVLDQTTSHPEFEAFYRDHIRKLLRVQGRARYLAKANYNLTRLEYLLELFPEARFVIPVREPVWHVASLMKQHALFCDGVRSHPKALEHLRRVGHFEFGPDRRPVNAGDGPGVGDVVEAWRKGREVEGWARYWSLVYGHVAERLARNPRLQEAALIVRFEDLCRTPREIIAAVLEHCRLEVPSTWVEDMARTIQAPSYYRPRFAPHELATIDRLTKTTATRFGYACIGDAAAGDRSSVQGI